MSIYDIKVRNRQGEEVILEENKGKVSIYVNTASKCGFTKQFDDLEALYQEYKEQGFTVIGIPSGDFKQELEDANAADEFCRLNYGVTFPIMDKVHVKGEEQAPIFKALTEEQSGLFGSKAIKWNFTKFLVDQKGNVVGRYAPKTSPLKMKKDIEALLNK